MTIYVNFGRSVSGIISDARRQFGDVSLTIVALDSDEIPVDLGREIDSSYEVIRCSKDGTPERYDEVVEDDVFILNGGTTPQMMCMMHLTRGGQAGRLVNLQRDGMAEMAKPPKAIWTASLTVERLEGEICRAVESLRFYRQGPEQSCEEQEYGRQINISEDRIKMILIEMELRLGKQLFVLANREGWVPLPSQRKKLVLKDFSLEELES